MGLLDKIKGDKHEKDQPGYNASERQSLEQNSPMHSHATTTGLGSTGSGIPGTSGYSSSSTGSAMPGQTTSTGLAGQQYGSGSPTTASTSSRAHELRHPVQSSAGSAGQYGSSTMPGSYAHGTNVDNDGYGAQTSGYKTTPLEAVDPRSTKGQNAMYNATPSSGNYGTSSNDYAGNSSLDNDINRSRTGGITNSMSTGTGNRTGGGYNLENPDAIPTAGGEKVGGLDSGLSDSSRPGHNEHHYGRDAGLVGGAGALGAGAYEERKHHDRDDPRYASSGLTNPTGTGHYNDRDDRYTNQGVTGSGNRDHHYGRDAAAVGGAGALGTGAYAENKHHLDREEKKEYKQEKKEEKKEEKEYEKEQKHREKEHEKMEKERHKELERREKEREKEEKQREKENSPGLLAKLTGKDKKDEPREGVMGGHDRYDRDHVAGAGQYSGRDGREGLSQDSAYPDTHAGGIQFDNALSSGQSGRNEHHYGRDAALVGGAGTLGTGAYEERKHHNDRDPYNSPSTGERHGSNNPLSSSSNNTSSGQYGNNPTSSSTGYGSTNYGGSGNNNSSLASKLTGGSSGSHHHPTHDEESEIEERLEEIRLNRRLKEIRSGRQQQ
ncbi:hypothetical protein LTR62_003391 [Meristemomyces frigidus]|uniref:Uncharacterized protein n=1 Tax=Meristemomyces frigidus TaxID=1508187 RepID=A0AAN7YGZ9_9PEZI|nr:hypothetical protein LTR62_003391 [Meristemomyces frigidus]